MTEAVAAWRRKAVDLLARREYSRAELARKLAGREADIDRAALDAVLDELAACGWQSDARFAQMWIQAHAARHGAQRLRQDLRQRGVATADIDAALAEHQAAELEQDELSRARAAWARKFAALPTNREDYARQYRFLASRGFASGIVSKVLSGRDRD